MFESVIDLVRYSRFELRELPVSCRPKGPNFKWASGTNILMAGNELTLKLPRHTPRHKIEQRKTKGDVVFNKFARRTGNGRMGDDTWKFFTGVSRQWRFNGPWLSGIAGAVSFSAQVVEPVEPNNKVSYFHPNVFEQALASYLTSCFSHKKRDEKCLWQAPVNWSRKESFPVFSACFDVLPRREGSPVHCCVFPVGDHYLAEITFTFDQACSGFMEGKDQKISREPMWELVNNILDSMTLTLSSENQAKVDKIKAECPDYALSETFPPLQWSGSSKTGEDNPSPALKLASY